MPLPPLPKRVCACGCGERFQPARSDGVYATNACKVRAYRARAKAQKASDWQMYLPLNDWELYASVVKRHPSVASFMLETAAAQGNRRAAHTWDAIVAFLADFSSDEISEIKGRFFSGITIISPTGFEDGNE